MCCIMPASGASSAAQLRTAASCLLCGASDRTFSCVCIGHADRGRRLHHCEPRLSLAGLPARRPCGLRHFTECWPSSPSRRRAYDLTSCLRQQAADLGKCSGHQVELTSCVLVLTPLFASVTSISCMALTIQHAAEALHQMYAVSGAGSCPQLVGHGMRRRGGGVPAGSARAVPAAQCLRHRRIPGHRRRRAAASGELLA